MQSRWFDFGGDTIIRTDRYIRLTPELPSRSGWLFSRVPLTATNWEIEFEFKIHGSGTLYGDGFAMWLTKERAQQGPVFGFKDNWDGLGIVFDTYKNNRPGVVFPLVMAMLGDGKTPYDSSADGKANELAACSARGIRNQQYPTKARLRYFHDKNLALDLMYKSENEWTNCFDVPGIKLPTVAYLGFSAETGELSDNHDIISVSTSNLYQPGGSQNAGIGKAGPTNANKYRGPGSTKEGGGWAWFFFKFVLFGFAVAGSYVGYTAYRTRQRKSRF